MHVLSGITTLPLHYVINWNHIKKHYELFMATKLKECLIKIHIFWLIWNL